VLGNVADGVGETKALVDRFNEVCAAMGEPDADFDKLLAEQAELQDKIDAAGAWDLERTFEIAMDALRLPPATPTSPRSRAGSAPGGPVPAPAVQARPAAPRRAHQPPRRRVGGLAGAHPAGLPGHVVAVTHDRYFLDNVAGWILELDRGPGIPWEGNYSSWLEQKQARLAGEEKADRPARRPWSASSSGSGCRPGPARARARPASTPTTTWWPRPRRPSAGPTSSRSPSRPGPRLGDRVVDAEGLVKGFGDRLLIDGLSFLLPPGGIVGVIGPNGAGKTTLFRMIVGEEKPDGGHARGRGHRAAGLRRPVPGRAGRRRHRLRRDHRRQDRIVVGNRELHGRAYVASFGFKGSDQQKKVGQLSGGERNRVQLAKVLKERRQRAAPRRAHQRPRRRHPAGARGGAAGFPGCAVVISHDRWFLDRVATHVLAFEGDSEVRGGRATSATTRPTARSGWASTPTSPTASATNQSPVPVSRDRVPQWWGRAGRVNLRCWPLRSSTTTSARG
jgi:sulfate-transporting ATPase